VLACYVDVLLLPRARDERADVARQSAFVDVSALVVPYIDRAVPVLVDVSGLACPIGY